MEPERITELKRRVELGKPLAEHEAADLKAYLSTKLMFKQSFDFGEIEQRLHGRLEEHALRERNARWARLGPKRPPIPERPEFRIVVVPLSAAARKHNEKMMEKFHAKLNEVIETGKIPTN